MAQVGVGAILDATARHTIAHDDAERHHKAHAASAYDELDAERARNGAAAQGPANGASA